VAQALRGIALHCCGSRFDLARRADEDGPDELRTAPNEPNGSRLTQAVRSAVSECRTLASLSVGRLLVSWVGSHASDASVGRRSNR
jgi:hypothetical protein